MSSGDGGGSPALVFVIDVASFPSRDAALQFNRGGGRHCEARKRYVDLLKQCVLRLSVFHHRQFAPQWSFLLLDAASGAL